jgi:endonuclease/exonuclease/phosphatase family metal-dependent hydrolase
MRTPLICALSLFAAVSLATAACADPLPEKIVVATWNVEWLFDNYTGDNPQELARNQSAPSREACDWKLAGIAKVIAEMKPTVLALQEVENKRVMFYLTSKLKKEYALDYEVAFIEGDDFFTEQDVAVLSLSGLVGFSFRKQTKEMYDTKAYYNVNKHIFCEFCWGEGPQKVELLVLNVHFRAQPDAGAIRTRQAKLVRHWLNDAIKAGANVAVIGDVNSEESYETTTNDGDLGTLRGLNTPATDDDLTDLFEFYKGESKETHLIHKQFDHILVTPSLVKGRQGGGGLVFQKIDIRKDLVIRGKEQDKDHMDIYWQIPDDERDVSDHYPVVAEFALQK